MSGCSIDSFDMTGTFDLQVWLEQCYSAAGSISRHFKVFGVGLWCVSSQLAASPGTSKPAGSAQSFEGNRCGRFCGRPASYCPYSSKEGQSQGDVQQAARVGPSLPSKLAEH